MIKQTLALGMATLTVGALGCSGGTGGSVVFDERNFVCAAGEATPCETTVEASTDAERTAVAPEGDPATYTFIVSTLSIPESMGGMAAGFNVDGIDSGMGTSATDATCEQFVPDFTSFSDPGLVGVDNALQGLLGVIEGLLDPADCPGGVVDGCLDALVQSQVDAGTVLLLMQLTNVNDLSFDSDIQLQLVLGALAPGSGTACTTDAECSGGERCISDTCENAPMLGADGHIAADQTFMNMQTLGAPVDGDIFEGRVRVSAPLITLQIDAGDLGVIPLMISNPEIRFDIDATSATNGQIGGYILNSDLIAAVSIVAPGMEGTVMALLENIADVQPSSADPTICEAMSVGVVWGGVSANVQ